MYGFPFPFRSFEYSTKGFQGLVRLITTHNSLPDVDAEVADDSAGSCGVRLGVRDAVPTREQYVPLFAVLHSRSLPSLQCTLNIFDYQEGSC